MKLNEKQIRTYACDFETTVYENQEETSVWSSAMVELYTENVVVLHSIDETLEYWCRDDCDVVAYYHNLKFDGAFWVDWLLNHGFAFHKTKRGRMKDYQFDCVISDMGQWYTITIGYQDKQITLKDSLKLLPFTLKQVGQAFQTKHQKLEMEYENHFSIDECTQEELEYIKNDVLVLKEGLEFMFQEGHDKLTIGSCCLAEYRKLIGKSYYDDMFPRLDKIELDEQVYGASNVDEYIRKSYHGGWCYVVPQKTNVIKGNGVTADVNSLYPSMMSSESGNRYPVGKPTFWKGDYIPSKALRDKIYYFITIRCSFRLKENYLPFIQIKGSAYYTSTECLTSSKPTFRGRKVDKIEFADKTITDIVELTLTQTDFELLKEHYYVEKLEILHGCYFYTDIGIFDVYIDKYRKIKQESKGAMRTLAKLFLNNLYGKMSSSTCSSYEVPVLEDGEVHYYLVEEYNKQSGYIACGSAITSYARNFTIRSAQANYYGTNKRGFIYADTDSIHCDLKPNEIKAITVHPTKFCCWKLESSWDKAIFVRQKTYIEHVTQEDLEDVEPYYNVKCAGMPSTCKGKVIDRLNNGESMRIFKHGLVVDGKLLPRRIKGGVVLVDTTYEMR